ncbi:MAG: DUF4065 domain-containing protein [Coriobacteriia bacterium]|nr:DUF4065 domain-containing protein [Coriobacteriia bacterium]
MNATFSIAKQIAELRERNSLTQEQASAAIGLSRQSYALIEQGKRDISLEELRILAGLFGVSIVDFFMQPADLAKFTQMYFYILKRLKSVPKTKLAKLLYLADFRNYYETLESMSGMRYICRTYGPVADVFFELTNDLFDQGKISITPKNDALIIAPTTRGTGEDLLTDEEKCRLDEIVDVWRDRRTKEIVNFTHEQKPWRSTRDGEYIPYELIIQEDPDHVYKPLA